MALEPLVAKTSLGFDTCYFYIITNFYLFLLISVAKLFAWLDDVDSPPLVLGGGSEAF